MNKASGSIKNKLERSDVKGEIESQEEEGVMSQHKKKEEERVKDNSDKDSVDI